MSYPFAVSLLDIERHPGRPAMLRAEAPGDAAGWAAEHREVLRAAVAEHGAVLVRGLGLRNAAEVGAVFRRLASALMVGGGGVGAWGGGGFGRLVSVLMFEGEPFASRGVYSDGVYSSAAWPASQPMCMH